MHRGPWNRAGRFFAQLATITIALSIIILYVFCLTSSTYSNPRIPQIFLAQIQKSNTSILIGFYGICTNGTPSPQICTTTINHSPDSIASILFPDQNQTASANATSLISFTLDLQQKIILSPLPIAAGLLLISLFFTLLTRRIAKRQRHLSPGRSLRYLRTLTLSLVWLSISLAFTSAVLATEMVNGVVYIVGTVGDGSMNVTAGGLLQVLLWVTTGISVVFAVVVVRILRDVKIPEGGRTVGLERGWTEFDDDHIIVI